MVSVLSSQKFDERVKRIKDSGLKERVKKRIAKIVENPESGKPLRHGLRGERCVKVPPYRIIYALKGESLIFLQIIHREDGY